MTTEEWLPGPSLTKDTAAKLIGTSFPGMETANLQHLGTGWQYDAFLTTDGWVFRFPRWDWPGDLFEREARVHRFVAEILPSQIRLPRVELLAPPSAQFPHPIAGHRYIAGVGAEEIDEKLLPTVAGEIATFLNALHSTPAPLAGGAGIHEFVMDENRRGWLDNGINVLRKLRGLDPVVDGAIGWLSNTPLTPHFDAPLHLIHGGLEPEHLIVDPATGFLQGVIDWTDTMLADAARDFVFLVTWRGWQFAEEVLYRYPRALDREFRTRLRHMAQLLSLMGLAYAHAQGEDLARHIRSVHNAFDEHVLPSVVRDVPRTHR